MTGEEKKVRKKEKEGSRRRKDVRTAADNWMTIVNPAREANNAVRGPAPKTKTKAGQVFHL